MEVFGSNICLGSFESADLFSFLLQQVKQSPRACGFNYDELTFESRNLRPKTLRAAGRWSRCSAGNITAMVHFSDGYYRCVVVMRLDTNARFLIASSSHLYFGRRFPGFVVVAGDRRNVLGGCVVGGSLPQREFVY